MIRLAAISKYLIKRKRKQKHQMISYKPTNGQRLMAQLVKKECLRFNAVQKIAVSITWIDVKAHCCSCNEIYNFPTYSFHCFFVFQFLFFILYLLSLFIFYSFFTNEREMVYLPHTMSNVHAFINGKMSKFVFPACLSNLSSIIWVFSLKIGTNDCKIFGLNDGFIIFRMGFQNAPASVAQI